MHAGSWVAVDASTDLRHRALELSRIRDEVAAGGAAPASLREPVARSWQRCREAGFDLEAGAAPVVRSAEEAAERWRNHPLSIAEPMLRELLADVRSDDDQVVLACDADGSLLWIDGEPAVLDAAHEIHLEPGALWSEAAAGTNAMGTALAAAHPIQIFSAEHLAEPVHGWTCSAAPIHDPVTGKLIGVIDLSGAIATAHPRSLALISAAAHMVEAQLRVQAVADDPGLAAETGALRIEALGRRRARIAVGTRWTELSPRHSEIVTLLALFPHGLDAARLSAEVYGPAGAAVSLRAEVSRLRRTLGDRLPRGGFGLAGEFRADFTEVERLLAAADVAAALAIYSGPLLPSSNAPLVVEARERLELAVRAACLASDDPRLVSGWLATAGGRDDVEAARTMIRTLPESAPGYAAAASRLRRLSRRRGPE